MSSSKYLDISLKLTNSLSKLDKQQNGIFFTSKDLVVKTFSKLLDRSYKTILEPSCGSGEFIDYALSTLSTTNITGIEYNKYIFDKIKDLYNCKLLKCDFLEYNKDYTIKYDLIIGNPPYYVIKNSKYSHLKEYIIGRPNIFCLFIIHSLKMLNENGRLAFIIPRNFLNSTYYNKIREYIIHNYSIIDIEYIKTDFLETKQEVIILYIENCKTKINNNYFIKLHNNYFLSNCYNIKLIKKLCLNSTTLHKLNCDVITGSVVWNTVKILLEDHKTDDNTLLVYSQNIKNNELNLLNNKKQYIKKKGEYKNCLLVNRGYGTGKYNFNYYLYNNSEHILIENHLNVITHPDINILKKIKKSFDDPRTLEFINNYFYNNSISKTELLYILPIYLN